MVTGRRLPSTQLSPRPARPNQGPWAQQPGGEGHLYRAGVYVFVPVGAARDLRPCPIPPESSTPRGYSLPRPEHGKGFVMSVADVVVLAGTVVALVGLGWFFFGPRRARTACLEDGVQRDASPRSRCPRPKPPRVRPSTCTEPPRLGLRPDCGVRVTSHPTAMPGRQFVASVTANDATSERRPRAIPPADSGSAVSLDHRDDRR